MLVSYHKGFVMEGEASFKERKHFWSKPELVRRKIYSTTGVYGICDDSELDAVVEDKIQRRLKSSGWGTNFSGWQRVLTFDEVWIWFKKEIKSINLLCQTDIDWIKKVIDDIQECYNEQISY